MVQCKLCHISLVYSHDSVFNKMANKTYHIVGTILKANRITIETDKINTINTHIHDRSEKLEHPKGKWVTVSSMTDKTMAIIKRQQPLYVKLKIACHLKQEVNKGSLER